MLRTGCALMLVALWSLPLAADEPAIELDSTLDLEVQTDFATDVEVDFVEDYAADVVIEQTLDFTADGEASVELVDPMPEELIFLTFSSEVVEGEVVEGEVIAEEGFFVEEQSEYEYEPVDPMSEESIFLTFSTEVEGEVIVAEGVFVEEHPGHEHECIEFIEGQCKDPDHFWIHARGQNNEVVADDELIMFSLSSDVENEMSIQTFGGPSLPAAAIEHANGVAFDASLGLRSASDAQAVVGLGLETAAAAQGQAGDAGLLGEVFSRTEADLVTEADRDYAARLATIDELRDRALVTGDATLLDRADRMEAELKAQSQTSAGFSLFGN